MTRFPVDAPIAKVIKALEKLDFRMVREGNHISMVRENLDGSRTPLTMPNHRRIKGSTLRRICTQAGISREEFLEAYRRTSAK
jgi:predicted RNA binding protein YcfA (HicA-like mRNA interferase family)